MKTLTDYRNEYYKIDKLKEPKRTLKLSELMTELEQVYNIPMLNNKDFNKNNKAIITLYQEISTSRKFD